MPALLTFDGLAYTTPDGRQLFENLSFALGRERVGLVGRNGLGKSTLIRLALGELTPNAGGVRVSGRVGVLRQAVQPPPGASVADILGVTDQLTRLRRIEAGEGDAADFAEADWSLEARLDAALAEVELCGVELDRAAATLSGGQLTRAALAGLLASEPDLLLLDEPTNNLDVEARRLVAAVLSRWRGGALVVSHDRGLLRQMDRIVELTSLGVQIYGGGYDLYRERKAEAEAAAARDLESAERAAAQTAREVQVAKERQARRDSVGRRFAASGSAPKIVLGAMARRAEETNARQSRLADKQTASAAEELAEAQAKVERIRRLAFDLPPSGLPAGRTVLAFDGVAFAYPGGPELLSGLDLQITGPGRVAVVGPNGSGKTTFIRLATGELSPTRGEVLRGASAALLDQHAAMLGAEGTLVEAFRRLNPEASENAARAALARFLFRNVAADKQVAQLSGGERLRAALACALMSVRPPQLLILDEPTNHLDLDSVEAMEAALRGYDGALIVVSHDQDFLTAVGVEREVRLG